MKKIRVVVIDDSALMRSILREIIDNQPDMETVAAAPDPIAAREQIRTLDPDVVTLDVEMPRMDGLDFLERLMRLRPMPVVMISSLTERGSQIAMRALELGAVDIVTKPKFDIALGIERAADEIADKIRAAALAKPRRRSNAPPPPSDLAGVRVSTEKIVAIGASTGGTEAIKDVLVGLPAQFPAIVITQHMPEMFTRSFAARLDSLAKLTVKEAEDGERVLPGHAYVAPGHSHMRLAKSGANYLVRLSQDEPVNRHRPSVDVLFDSVAAAAGANSLGVILTGMGKDGAAGLARMKARGAYTFAQDEASCVVFGMPREAIAQGGVDEIVPISEMAQRVLSRLAHSGPLNVRI